MLLAGPNGLNFHILSRVTPYGTAYAYSSIQKENNTMTTMEVVAMSGGEKTIPRGPEPGRGSMQGQCTGGDLEAWPGDFCICPACGTKTPHRTDTPCIMERCPRCGAAMTPYNPLPPYGS